MQDNVYESISEFIVDEEKVHCPYRERKTRGGKQITFSDHCAMILTMEITTGPPQCNGSSKMKVWDLNEDGYAKYTEETSTKFRFDVTGSSTTVAQW